MSSTACACAVEEGSGLCPKVPPTVCVVVTARHDGGLLLTRMTCRQADQSGCEPAQVPALAPLDRRGACWPPLRQLARPQLLLDQPGLDVQVLRGHSRRPAAQGHPSRCPHQLDRQPRAQASRDARLDVHGQEEQGSQQGPQIQQHQGRQEAHLEEAEHSQPVAIQVDVSVFWGRGGGAGESLWSSWRGETVDCRLARADQFNGCENGVATRNRVHCAFARSEYNHVAFHVHIISCYPKVSRHIDDSSARPEDGKLSRSCSIWCAEWQNNSPNLVA